MSKYHVKTINKIINIINDEIEEIESMKPDVEENDVSYGIRKQHYLSEVKAIKARIWMELEMEKM